MKKFFQRSKRSTDAVSQVNVPSSSYITAPYTSGHASVLGPKFNVPAIPHPSPHTRIDLSVTSRGILLRPHISGVLNTASYVLISWGKGVDVKEVAADEDTFEVNWSEALVIHGILGFLKLFADAYLLVITDRNNVGSFLDPAHTVYGIKSVSAIPLDHERALRALKTITVRDVKEDAIASSTTSDTITLPQKSIRAYYGDNDEGLEEQFTSIAESSKEYPKSDNNKILSLSSPADEKDSFQQTSDTKMLDTDGNLDDPNVLGDARIPLLTSSVDGNYLELESRIVKECLREFTKGSMYFSYNIDITTSLQLKIQQVSQIKRQNSASSDISRSAISETDKVDILTDPNSWLPLWRRVDRQFWWNEWMLQPLIDAGLHSYIMPVMQGFYQVSSFHIPRNVQETDPEEDILVDYAIISRRSRDRAGLRYQRRGVDDEANVANFVETETLMGVVRDGVKNVFSYVQIRGSVPLYWIQSGYGLKPPPQLSLDRDHQQNIKALSKHLQKIVSRYGSNILVNLMEQSGKEATLSNAYRDYVTELKMKEIKYAEYDFHAQTKGMKYENIAALVSQMEKSFESQGFLWISDSRLLSRQKGVFRVNCADCLDRTNVVQSAFARHMLTTQLSAVALLNNVNDKRTEMETVFNNLWANNGDAISRAYAGTSALKGDFTRTGKRDLGGMINDGINSLARMYSSTFSDWFSQAVIDFMLGNRTLSVFSEFLSKLQSTDPRERIRLSKIRAEAIATAVSRVLSDGERLLSGWILLSPTLLNTKFSYKFEEKILLLTVSALYIVSYDYQLEKVIQYTRVALGNIETITKGAYIISPLEEGSREISQNYGLMVTFGSLGQTTRLGNRSLNNTINSIDMSSLDEDDHLDQSKTHHTSNATSDRSKKAEKEKCFVAFKALPVDPARWRRESRSFEEPSDDLSGVASCKEAVDIIVDAICRACEDVGNARDSFVLESDIVSLSEARHMTSLVAKMEYGLKRMIWLGT